MESFITIQFNVDDPDLAAFLLALYTVYVKGTDEDLGEYYLTLTVLPEALAYLRDQMDYEHDFSNMRWTEYEKQYIEKFLTLNEVPKEKE